MQESFDRGLKAKTVSHYLAPIRSASRFMAANWPESYQDICASLRQSPNSGRSLIYRDDDGIASLSFGEVLDFLDWLGQYAHTAVLTPAVLLQGVCGLQLREALRLRWDLDVDLEKGTITIQDHPEFEERVKNRYRVRRIPLPTRVWKNLAGVERSHPKVVPYDGDSTAFGKLLRRALHKWNPDCAVAPKDLRNTLQTHALEHAADEGWNTYLVDRYVGHAPKTVMERHYFGDKNSRMVGVFREHVVTKIDGLIDGLQSQNGTIKARIIEMACPNEEAAQSLGADTSRLKN